jgi:alkanesulfonate monooxygenase SsuD/methylene tetrahydromethanopterin reductase-like flavin-dependent oxidoreductase (luciferase family)
VRLSVLVEGAHGLTWPRWKEFVGEVERLGFTGLYGSDHFTLAAAPPDRDSLELVVSLTYAAGRSEHLTLGQLVSPVSFRDPVMLTRQMLALDDLSGGRMVYGIGAGWNVREHTMFGYDLGDIKTRMDRFAESLEVITRLMRSDEPVSYSGIYYHLEEATLLPRPQRPGGPPLLIGGGGPKRTLPLVARYADIWNAVMITPDALQEKLALLDTLIVAAGRQLGDVARTLMTPVYCGRNTTELAHRASGRRATPALTDLSDEALVEQQRGRGAIMGTPDEIIDRIRVYEGLGVEEIMVQWFALDDLDGLRMIAADVLPRVQG